MARQLLYFHRVRYTIEARELTRESTHSAADGAESRRVTIEATGPDEAISRFVRSSDSELVSFVSPKGRESIATIRRNDSVYLVRVYTN